MSKVIVKYYGVSWDSIRNKGRVVLVLQDREDPAELPVNSASELSAIGVVLAQAPVYFNAENGTLSSGWEAPD